MKTLRTLAVLALLAGAASGCGQANATEQPWHDGRLYIATGNTTGVYYQLGGGYADVISRHLPGYEARAEPTSASGENIRRVASGDMHMAFSLADTAADAVAGRGAFAGKPQRVAALARVYRNFTHVIVPANAKVGSVKQLRGKRVSTGSQNSGTDVLAGRMLEAAGLNPARDITRLRLSLPETVKGMKAGTIDALFWSGGLPTPGITDLLTQSPGKFSFVPLGDLLAPLNKKYGNVYSTAKIPKKHYGTTADVDSIAVANLILVSITMPDRLARDLTRVLYEHQAELAKAHPEGKNFDRTSGAVTDPVPLHPGARAYYASHQTPTAGPSGSPRPAG
jgi:hypothetical protein